MQMIEYRATILALCFCSPELFLLDESPPCEGSLLSVHLGFSTPGEFGRQGSVTTRVLFQVL